MLTSWSNYIIAISHSKMGTNKHSRINLTNAFLCSIYCAKCFQTWKGAGSYHWSRNTSCVKKKKKQKWFSSGLRRWICFIRFYPGCILSNKIAPRYVMCLGSTIHHFKHILSSLPISYLIHDAAQKCDCPQEPKPVIYYLAVFCLTWVHSASLTVALSQAASPYL